jgi:hypothetical protein
MRCCPLRRAFASATIAAVLLCCAAGSADAQERIVRDDRGEAADSADVVRVRVNNGQSLVHVTTKIADLARGTDITLTVNHDGRGHYILRTGGVGPALLTFARKHDEARVRCPGLSVRRQTGPRSRMIVRVPQRCFHKRAGTAAFDLVAWQARGTDSDRVPAMPVTVRRG